MKPRFRWQTEDDKPWPETEPEVKPPVPSRWRRLLGAAGIVVTVVALVVWQQARQVAIQEANLRADILASHRTWQKAVIEADLELFTFLISPADPDWQEAQQQLFSRDLVLNRTPLGLDARATPAETTAVALDPNWRAATVTYEQSYRVLPDAMVTDTVRTDGIQTNIIRTNIIRTNIIRLQQVSHYQRDRGHWLQTPLPADFWGKTQTYNGRWLTLTYPRRDAAWAERMGDDLDAELDAICDPKDGHSPEVSCPARIQVRLATDPASLAALPDLETPAFDGRSYLLPAPTLAGLPVDDAGYDALYHGYTHRILRSFRSRLAPPLPLPAQDLAALCFPDRRQPLRLFRYDIRADAWTAVFPDRAFRFLTPLPDDSGLILQASVQSDEANRLTLNRWQAGEETPLLDEPNSRWRFPPLGWSGSHLLLHGFDAASQVRTLYQWVDLDNCEENTCATLDLPGFTVWSPDGRFSLVLMRSELWLGDGQGRPLRHVDNGFSPFWLDNTTFGYVRYVEEEGERLMELAAATIGDAAPRVLLRAEQLTAVLGEDAGLAFIRHAIANPADSETIILMGPEIQGDNGRYNVFSLQFDPARRRGEGAARGQLNLLLQLDKTPRGYPTQLPPTGVPPVSLSPDGRWLLAAELTYPEAETWAFHLYDLSSGDTRTLTSSAPAYPAYYPFYDWSANGRWLAVVDDGFLRLVAPEQDYEQLVTFDHAACLFTAWID